MSDSYQEALRALATTTGSVAHVDDLPIGCEYEENYPVDLENSLFVYIEKGDSDGAVSAADSYFGWMRETNGENLMAIRLKVLEFALRAERMAYLNGGQTYRFTSRDDYLPQIMGMDNLEALKKWFLDKIAEAVKNIQSKQEERSSSIISQTKEYIKTHFSKDISLDDVSRQVNISPYYFSKIFKEETGENFIEYLTNIRIEKAKDLLRNTEYSMKEICTMCGYADPNYFSRTFRKNVGVTPTEYKEGKSSEG